MKGGGWDTDDNSAEEQRPKSPYENRRRNNEYQEYEGSDNGTIPFETSNPDYGLYCDDINKHPDRYTSHLLKLPGEQITNKELIKLARYAQRILMMTRISLKLEKSQRL